MKHRTSTPIDPRIAVNCTTEKDYRLACHVFELRGYHPIDQRVFNYDKSEPCLTTIGPHRYMALPVGPNSLLKVISSEEFFTRYPLPQTAEHAQV